MPHENPTLLHRSAIAFAMLSETGHYHGSFRLARTLQQRGHSVWFIGIADFAEMVGEQGFNFVTIAEDLLPKGYLEDWNERHSKQERRFVELQSTREKRLFRAFVEYISDGRLDSIMQNPRPDLLVCDSLTWYFALRAHKLGIRTVQLNITLSYFPNDHIPPVVFEMQPTRSRLSRTLTMLAWRYLGVKHLFTKRLATILFGAYRYPHRMHHLVDVFRMIADRSGFPMRRGMNYSMSETGPMLAMEEIVLCPKAFNFPYPPNAPDRTHVGAFVDPRRTELPLPEGALDTSKPLIVCSLSTNASQYPHSTRFYRCVFEASRLQPEWQFVLHLANPELLDRLPAPSENLLVRSRIPQLDLLRRAAVMVTHGGINSIIECIHFSVPMVILPGLRDQPGAAARARHHGLALVESMATITPAILVSRMREAMEDQSMRRAITRMRREIAEEDGLNKAVTLLEKRAIAARFKAAEGHRFQSGTPSAPSTSPSMD